MIGFKQQKHQPHKILAKLTNQPNGWYVTNDFHFFLRRERHRSLRNNLPATYVSIDISEYFQSESPIPLSRYYDFLIHLVKFLTTHIRFIDAKSLINDYRVDILLVDTSIEQVELFLGKLSKELLDYFKSLKSLDFLVILKTVAVSACNLSLLEYGIPKNGHSQVIKRKLLRGVAMAVPDDTGLLNGHDYLKQQYQDSSDGHTEQNINEYANGHSDFIPHLSERQSILANNLFDLKLECHRPHFGYYFIKRLMDIVGAITGMILFLPAFMIVSLIIKATSPGPVLYKQKRVGYKSVIFTLMKLRSMRTDGDSKIHQEYVTNLIKGQHHSVNNGTTQKPLYKLKGDPRITPIGRFIRKTSLDEIPQFLNVLMGSMSLVGPRPPIPYEVDLYQDWHLQRVMQAKPGITGLWQVYGRNKTSFDEMVRLDLQYLKRRSIWLDCKLIVKTLFVLLNFKSGI